MCLDPNRNTENVQKDTVDKKTSTPAGCVDIRKEQAGALSIGLEEAEQGI